MHHFLVCSFFLVSAGRVSSVPGSTYSGSSSSFVGLQIIGTGAVDYVTFILL